MLKIRNSLTLTLWTVAALTWLAHPSSAADEPVQVSILAGQSNMAARGKTWDGLTSAYDASQPQSATNRREMAGGIGLWLPLDLQRASRATKSTRSWARG